MSSLFLHINRTKFINQICSFSISRITIITIWWLLITWSMDTRIFWKFLMNLVRLRGIPLKSIWVLINQLFWLIFFNFNWLLKEFFSIWVLKFLRHWLHSSNYSRSIRCMTWLKLFCILRRFFLWIIFWELYWRLNITWYLFFFHYLFKDPYIAFYTLAVISFLYPLM